MSDMIDDLKNIFGGDGGEDCPLPSMVMAMMSIPRPFGIMWHPDKIKKFLKKRGYILVDRINPDTDENVTVACKPDDEIIPESENLIQTFKSEVEDILLDWLLENGK